MKQNEISQLIANYYDEKLRDFGTTPKGVDWKDDFSQIKRLNILLEVVDDMEHFSILDYGCGYGALYDALIERFDSFSYVGTDVSPSMLETLKLRYTDNENVSVVAPEVAKRSKFDFVVASGIFNVKFADVSDWEEYVFRTLDEMFQICQEGYATNFLSAHSDKDFQKEHLYYAEPARVLSYILEKHSKCVKLVHHPDLYDFSVIVSRT
jgi:cyclopropane fatty-acyl-phospholipid synthase-like methyltransferase